MAKPGVFHLTGERCFFTEHPLSIWLACVDSTKLGMASDNCISTRSFLRRLVIVILMALLGSACVSLWCQWWDSWQRQRNGVG